MNVAQLSKRRLGKDWRTTQISFTVYDPNLYHNRQ